MTAFADTRSNGYIIDFETNLEPKHTETHLMPLTKTPMSALAISALLFGCASEPKPLPDTLCKNCINSLRELSIESLKQRGYGSSLELVSSDSDGHFLAYTSDSLRLYSRLVLPDTPPPATGYPIVIYAHGWVGLEKAPSYNFGAESGSLANATIQQMRAAGFAVLIPGFRGHGTVDGVAAEGIASMAAWDNASYLSPIFYTIDTLNLIDSLEHLQQLEWPNRADHTPFNLDALHIIGHSQGGDVALSAMAISGEGSRLEHAIKSGAIISGCFPDRFTQLQTYSPMQKSQQAFLSGDGSWTGSAIGKNGKSNPYFIFAYPSHWIGTVDTLSAQWTWQDDRGKQNSVNEVVLNKYQEMYTIYNRQVLDLSGLTFEITSKKDEAIRLQHDNRLPEQLKDIGAYNAEHYLKEPIAFHYSDRDYYSIPLWNKALSERINAQGGQAFHFPYPGNTHSLQLSSESWFSPQGSRAGLTQANSRNIALFEGRSIQ